MRCEIRNDSGVLARRSEPARRKGFALAAALLTLLLISALVAGVLFAVTEETRASVASAERQLALSTAESAVEMTIANGSAGWPGAIGASVTRSATTAEMGAPVAVHITRLDSTLYWIVGDATAPSRGSGVSRRIGVTVRKLISSDHSITIDRISERSWSELF